MYEVICNKLRYAPHAASSRRRVFRQSRRGRRTFRAWVLGRPEPGWATANVVQIVAAGGLAGLDQLAMQMASWGRQKGALLTLLNHDRANIC